MAEMTPEEKKYKALTTEAEKLQDEYASRKFSYNPDSDKGYQDYVRLMRENGKAAMEDTVGKVSALTGGYGNSWAVSAGQKAYNQYAKQAAEAQATYRQLARSEFDAENQDILNRLSMINTQKAGLSQGPTEEQIAYAKNVYKTGGTQAFDDYLASIGVTDDVMWSKIKEDTGFLGSQDAYKWRFTLAGDGGWNGFGGLDNDAKLTLDAGGEGAVTKTVKEWLTEFTTAKNEDGSWKYAWHDEADAKKILLDLQERLGV